MSNKYGDLTGQKFGRLTVIERDFSRGSHDRYWVCKCICGNYTSVSTSHLINEKTSSCGCLRKEVTRQTHGEHFKSGKSIHNVWMSMIARCENSNAQAYDSYGGRGIYVCDEWHNFIDFYEWAINNGYEEGLTIDRINNNDGYNPYNCRWIGIREQCWNRRNTIYIEYNGEIKPLPEWCDILGLSYSRTRQRIFKLNWTVEEAFETI